MSPVCLLLEVKRTEPLSVALSANDPGCVKTHTSAKCRKHNSPARHPTSRVQYDLTLRDAIAQRYFYVWRERRSFRTAKTRCGILNVRPGTTGLRYLASAPVTTIQDEDF